MGWKHGADHDSLARAKDSNASPIEPFVKTVGAVLVTGGGGFIGTNLVRALVSRGERVVALDNEFLGRLSNLDGVPCTKVRGDCLDDNLIDRIVRRHGVNRVAHLAGYTSAPMFDVETKSRMLENFTGFLNILDVARHHSLRVVYASTSSFYARSPKPFREDAHIVPATPYELSKYVMEQAAHMYNRQYGVVANGLRFFSVYGPHERHKGRFGNNISQFLWSIRNGIAPVVFGDGRQTRDFTYVGDLVDAILLVLAKGQGSEVYNIGTGREYSFNEMIALVNKSLGTNVSPTYVQNPIMNYVRETLADTTKIEREIGWKATTGLEEGIRKLADSGEEYTKRDAEQLYGWISTAPRSRSAGATQLARPLGSRRIPKPRRHATIP